MIDLEVGRCTRRCAETDRELAPGETVFSVLLPAGGDVVRRDYSAQAWSGAPDEAIGWWKSRVPEPASKKLHWAPNDIILNYFEELADRPSERDTRYVLALLMVRRRIVRLEEEEVVGGNESLVLYCPRNERQYRAAVVVPDRDRAAEIQSRLAELLFGGSEDDKEATDEAPAEGAT